MLRLFRFIVTECSYIILFLLMVSKPFMVWADIYDSDDFRHYDISNGLAHNKVNAFLTDRRGFLWIGTEDGLTRFDGRYFVNLNINNGKQGDNFGNIITGLCQGKDDKIWIATANGGLVCYDHTLAPAQQFKRYLHRNDDPHSIPAGRISQIGADRDGNIWLLMDGNSVVCFDVRSNTFVTFFHLWNGRLRTMAIAPDNKIWLAGDAHRVYTIDIKTRNLSQIRINSASVTAIFADETNTIWYGDEKGELFYKKAGHKRFSVMLCTPGNGRHPADKITSINKVPNGKLWIGYDDSGVAIVDLSRSSGPVCQHVLLSEHPVAGDHINIIFSDSKGIVWIGADNGIYQLNPLFSPFQCRPLPQKFGIKHIYDLYEDGRDNLWIATDRGVFKESGKDHRLVKLSTRYQGHTVTVTKFFKDVDGTFYWGSEYTLFTFDERSGRLATLANTGKDSVMGRLNGSPITCITRDTLNGHPAIVVLPYGKDIRFYDLVKKHWYSFTQTIFHQSRENALNDPMVKKLLHGKDGHFWLATIGQGLEEWRKDPKAPVVYYQWYNALQQYNGNDIYDIEDDQHGNLWVSSYGGGLNQLDRKTNRLRHIKESSNLTEGVLPDHEGNLWMICNGHFHKYEIASRKYSCYDIPELRTSEGVHGYISQGNHGNLYAAGGNFYVKFDSRHVPDIDLSPPVYFTDFKIFNKSYNQLLTHAQIYLNESQNYFSFEFSAPDFGADNIQYAYRLVGVDRHWIMSGVVNTASYSNLKPGHYRFEVKATNWKGTYAAGYSSVNIVVDPPFYETPWFFLLTLAFICCAIYRIYMYQIRELIQIQNVRNGIAKDLHDQVGSTLSSIAVYSEVAKIYQQQDKVQEVEELLKVIGETCTGIVQEMTDIVWAIDPKNDHLESMIKRIESFARPLCAAKGIRFKIKASSQLFNESFDMPVRKNIFLILKEAINNAIKHSGCSLLEVNLELNNRQVVLTIKDNGVGVRNKTVAANSSHSLSGNGLHNMQLRADQLNGTFDVSSAETNGTKVTVTFKVF